jgi:hypothetical protein
MITLNNDFKKAIKSIILEHYDITCHKIDDITNYAGGAKLLIYSLNCTIGNKKSTLYLHIPKPVDTISPQDVNFEVCAQYISVDRINDISKLLFTNELDECLKNLTGIFKNSAIDLIFSTNRTPSVSLVSGTVKYKNKKFEILNYKPLLYAGIEIYADSLGLHSQMKLCDFFIYGNSIELSRRGTDLNLFHIMTDRGSLPNLIEKLFKFYIVLLKDRLESLDSVTINDIEQASLDNLINMIQVFQMERI